MPLKDDQRIIINKLQGQTGVVHTTPTTLPQLALGGGSRVGRLYQTGVVHTTTTLPQLALGGGSNIIYLYIYIFILYCTGDARYVLYPWDTL